VRAAEATRRPTGTEGLGGALARTWARELGKDPEESQPNLKLSPSLQTFWTPSGEDRLGPARRWEHGDPSALARSGVGDGALGPQPCAGRHRQDLAKPLPAVTPPHPGLEGRSVGWGLME